MGYNSFKKDYMKKRNGYGFSGAHRTGKTSLAMEIAKRENIPFVKSSVTDIFTDLGYSPDQDYSIDTRIMIQNKILDVCVEQWKSQTGTFVTDRTPIDMIAYMLASSHQEDINDAIDIKIQEYIQRCIDATDTYFDTIFEIHPGIPIAHASGKANSSVSYIQHIALIITGIMSTVNVHTNMVDIGQSVIDFEERLSDCSWYFPDKEESL